MSGFTLGNATYTKQDIINVCTRDNDNLERFFNSLTELKSLEDPFTKADEIALTFKSSYGLIIVDAEYYHYQHVFKTVMDMLCETFSDFYEPQIDPVIAWVLYRSFKKYKFKHSADCTIREMRESYATTRYPAYGLYPDVTVVITSYKPYYIYEYQQIKDDNFKLNKELMEYIYHPTKIQQWIMKGNEVDSYLE